MIVLGKKQSVLIDFLCCLNGGCLSGSHYLPSDLPECLHVGMDSGAPLKMRINTHRGTHTHAHTRAKKSEKKHHAPLTYNTCKHSYGLVCVCVCAHACVCVCGRRKRIYINRTQTAKQRGSPAF